MNLNNSEHKNETILGINARNANYVYEKNPRKHLKLANDKLLAKQRMEEHKIATAKTYGIIRHLGEIEEVWQQVQQYDEIVLKPANGSGGDGILVLKRNKKEWETFSGLPKTKEEIFFHIANTLMGIYSFGDSDQVIIEYCVHSHSFLLNIYPAGVADFRIILLDGVPVLSMLRVPTTQSGGKANLHQGGMGIGIDMATGKLKKGFLNDRHYRIHPDTKFRMEGTDIPYWNEMLTLSIETAKAFPELGYLGIDIVLDEQLGPLIMEINGRPGLGIQVVNQVGLRAKLQQSKPNYKALKKSFLSNLEQFFEEYFAIRIGNLSPKRF